MTAIEGHPPGAAGVALQAAAGVGALTPDRGGSPVRRGAAEGRQRGCLARPGGAAAAAARHVAEVAEPTSAVQNGATAFLAGRWDYSVRAVVRG